MNTTTISMWANTIWGHTIKTPTPLETYLATHIGETEHATFTFKWLFNNTSYNTFKENNNTTYTLTNATNTTYTLTNITYTDIT